MTQCITCEGSGTINFTLISNGKSTSSPMNCIDCEGTGLITKEWKKKLKDAEKFKPTKKATKKVAKKKAAKKKK